MPKREGSLTPVATSLKGAAAALRSSERRAGPGLWSCLHDVHSWALKVSDAAELLKPTALALEKGKMSGAAAVAALSQVRAKAAEMATDANTLERMVANLQRISR